MEIIEKECPYCHSIINGNIKTYANHIRWCKSNPKYKDIFNGTIEKLKGNKVPHNEYHFKCVICDKNYSLILTENDYEKGKYRKTCSDECSKKLTAKNTDLISKNQKVSNTMREKVTNDKVIYKKICPICKKEFLSLKENQIYCSKECAREGEREKDLKNRDEIHIYKLMCKFQFGLSNYPEEFDFSLIKKYGWYQASNRGDNLKGVSRDHMFSVNEGYKQEIDPYYISHPANCKLMLQEDNFKKLANCSITKEELIKRVEKWNKKYGIYKNKINYKYLERFKDKH